MGQTLTQIFSHLNFKMLVFVNVFKIICLRYILNYMDKYNSTGYLFKYNSTGYLFKYNSPRQLFKYSSTEYLFKYSSTGYLFKLIAVQSFSFLKMYLK